MSENELRNEVDRLRRENEALAHERRTQLAENNSIIHSKLDSIAIDIKTLVAKQAAQSGEIRAVKDDADVLSTILLGPNGKPDEGIAVRFKSMEDSHKNGRKIKIAVGVAAVSAAFEAVCRRFGL